MAPRGAQADVADTVKTTGKASAEAMQRLHQATMMIIIPLPLIPAHAQAQMVAMAQALTAESVDKAEPLDRAHMEAQVEMVAPAPMAESVAVAELAEDHTSLSAGTCSSSRLLRNRYGVSGRI